MSSVNIILYDLSKWNVITHYMGLGRYFSAVEVYEKVYYFRPPEPSSQKYNVPSTIQGNSLKTRRDAAAAGVVAHGTKVENVGGILRERKRVRIGDSSMSRIDVVRTLKDLSLSFNGEYDALSNNSNHFCNQFCRLLCGKSIPDWILFLSDLTLLLRFS